MTTDQKHCVNCVHCHAKADPQFSTCGRAIKHQAKLMALVTGQPPTDDDFTYCTVERDDLCGPTVCGSEGRFFERKPE